MKVCLLAIPSLSTLWGDASHGTKEPSHVGGGVHMENDARGQVKDTP